MCGIAGLYHLNRKTVPAYALKSMCDVMRHRGPDDEGYVFFHVRDEPYKYEGYWVEFAQNVPAAKSREEWDHAFNRNGDFNLALGHRRLSIIDLTPTGHQPMSNRANGLWITFNGEIYNFKADTEVIIHLYEEYGLEALNRLNGIFAFALWDGQKNRLILARDRYGAKPLYYTVQNNLLIFASEIKALLEVEGVQARLNHRALIDYFTFQNTFDDLTLFEDIHLLEAGHYLVIEDNQISKKQFWDFRFEEGPDEGESFYTNRIQELFSQVIKRQLISDVPVGSYLSGGLDSGSITAFASKIIPRLMTFTGGFDVATAVSIENFFDERDKAELISRKFGTEHYQMVIHAGDLEWALPNVIWHMEDLRVGMSYPHYYLSRLASKFVKVVLAGPGGDETLGGYPWRYDLIKGCRTCGEFERISYQYWSRLIKDEDKKNFFTSQVLQSFDGYSPLESFKKIMNKDVNSNFIKKALYFDAKTFLHGILVVEDKLSMAHSLESRVPFLDNELVDFTTSIPTKYLINDSWIKSANNDVNLSGKYIFRRAMEGTLPKVILENRKQGFSAPEQSWYMQRLVNYIKNVILSERSLNRGYFKRQYIEKVLEEHTAGKMNHRLLIWSLLSFEWWNRIFIDGEKIEDIRGLNSGHGAPPGI
ncbi:MAG: asparagine synthase (glutamine-hydrolyzing) [Deltaproteobacteria bacterium]|nr:asparagine synthase (glutamine-hydrolyzing) [Deltaproteobacteria bacterium]